VIDYNRYSFTNQEKIIFTLQFLGINSMISYLFYNSYLPFLIFLPLFFPYIKYQRNRCLERRKAVFNVQFKEMMISISSSLQVGYSMENAIRAAYKELSLVFLSSQPIMLELEYMERQLSLNLTVEEILMDLSQRTKIEDVQNFADTFITAKKMGGDIISILSNTTRNISEKVIVREEISVVISGKRMEQRIMCTVPFGIIFYIRCTSPNFLNVVYGNLSGVILMSICLVIYGLSYYLGIKIMKIEV
jgi:tight adherence protein B